MAVTFSFGDIIAATIQWAPKGNPMSGIAGKVHTFMVLLDSGDADLTVCMVTSNMRGDKYEVEARRGDGNLHHDSYIRTHKITLLSKRLDNPIRVGHLQQATIDKVRQTIISWL